MTTFDEILVEAGEFGRFQKRVFGLFCLVSMPWACVFVGIVFQGFTPEHWCRNPVVEDLRGKCGWTLEEERKYTVPLINTTTGPAYSQCQRYDVDWNSTIGCSSPQPNFTVNYGNDVPLTTCQDGWVFDYKQRSSFVTEFNLVCSDAWMVDLFQSILNLGFLVGTIVMGYVADRYGRKLCFLVSTLANAITGILVAVSPNYIALVIFWGLFGFPMKGGWVTGYVLLTELVGVDYRRTVGIIYQMFFSVGILILPLIAYLIPNWRWLQVAITAPYFFFLLYYWWIPESPRWLLSQKRPSEAVTLAKEISKVNGKTLSKNVEALTDGNEELLQPSFLDLVRTPKMRKHTFILMFNWFTCAVVYQGLIMRLGILGGNVYIDFLISGVVEFPAAFLIIVTIERMGRRIPFTLSNIVSGAACLIAAFIPADEYWAKTLTACIGRLGITMAFEMVCFVNAELYPTFVRNLAVSVCSTLCDIGGIVAPFLLYRLAVIWLELPLVIFGILAFIAGGLVLLLPETKGRPLPETIDDIENPKRTKETKTYQLVTLLPSDVTTNKDSTSV
ncbi:solute carrier family 22 member 2-like [Polyodon spathula]|uniref:solute carrier family 22 member 2-like n=1 Tax=Polyodon spathula TaxID=7913 RepID=UPI001B7DB33D|nr:solute carrier family 22 member 2-like [Polyodon spathula]